MCGKGCTLPDGDILSVNLPLLFQFSSGSLVPFSFQELFSSIVRILFLAVDPLKLPITAGIFVSIVAWASEQRTEDKTPYWRTLKAKGELNAKYPGGIEAQKEKLEAEGHTIIQKGRKNIRYYVEDYEKALFDLK